MSKNAVIISVLADSKQFTKGLDDAGKSAGGLGSAMKVTGLAVAAGLAVAGAATIKIISDSIKAAGEYQKITAQTEAVVKSTGGAAGRTVQQISALTEGLADMSGQTDEAVTGAENMLLTFAGIKGDTFDQAAKASLNMSQALGIDATSAAAQLGKALNDPVVGISKLTKVGVVFTEQQKAQITAMSAAGDVAGAQGVILAELQKEYGGSAEAFGNTYEGAIGKLKSSVGRLQVTLGTAFLPVLTKLFSKAAGALNELGKSPAFTNLVSGVAGFISNLLSGDSAIGKFIGRAVTLMSAVSPLGLVFKALAPMLPQLAKSFGQLAAILSSTLAQILPTITGLAKTLVSVLGSVFASVLPVIVQLVGQLGKVFVALLPSLTPIITILGGVLSTILKALGPIIGTVAAALGGVLGQVLKAITPIIVLVAQVFAQVLKALAPLVPALMPLISAVLSLLAPLIKLIGSALGPIIELFGALLKPILGLITPLIDLLMPAITGISTVLSVVVGWIAQALTFFVALITGSKTAAAQFTGAFSGIGKFFGDLIGGVVRFFSDSIGNIVGFFASLPGRIVGALGDLAGTLGGIGRNLIQGLINGVGSMLGNLGSFVANLAKKFIIDPIKNALGIHSPSKVFAQIGQYTVQGLAQGLDDTASVKAAMSSLSSTVAGATIESPTVVSSARAEAAARAAESPVVSQVLSQMSASDRLFFRDLFREFAGSLKITDGAIAQAANSANARLVKAGAR